MFYHTVVRPKDADRLVNSLITVYTVWCLPRPVCLRKLRLLWYFQQGLLEDKSPDNADTRQDDDKPLAESTPKKSEQGASNDTGNQSLDSNASGYATANQSAADSPAIVPVAQLVDIPLQDSSSEVSTFKRAY